MGGTSVVAFVLLMFAWSAQAEPWDRCFGSSAARFAVPVAILHAIAAQESAMKPTALHRNRDGSYDIGLMQINSRWLSRLEHFGIHPLQLWDPCVSIEVGAWILAGNIRRVGYTWEAVGAYNAGFAARNERARWHYANKIYRRLG